MKHRTFIIVTATALTLTLGACGSDDEQTVPTPTVPEYLTVGTDQRPLNWVAPDYTAFEYTMSLQVQLGDTLAYYQSDRDLMCVTINDEIRAVTVPYTTMNEVYFPLTIASNGREEPMTLCYYCDRLHRIYTLPHWTTFTPAIPPTGNSDIYRPRFAQ